MQFRTVAENLRLLIFYLTILCFSDTSNAIDKCYVLYATKMLLLQKYLLPLLIFLFSLSVYSYFFHQYCHCYYQCYCYHYNYYYYYPH